LVKIQLERIGRAIAKCWERAEGATAVAIAEKHPHPAEEEITFTFCGELRLAVENASTACEFEQAFIADLRSHLPDLATDGMQRIRGLVARVNPHGRWHEGHKSASDLGGVITRPMVRRQACETLGNIAPLIPLFLPYSALSSPEISELSPSFRFTGSFS
jgi:hypothetical protein